MSKVPGQTKQKMSAEEIGHRILEYLLANPEAQDTLEGIVEWWLREPLTETKAAEVKKALDALVSADLLLQHKGRDSQAYYKINRRRLKKILELLKLQSPSG